MDDENAVIRGEGIAVTLDLASRSERGLVGWKAKKHGELVDVDARDRYDPLDFWDPITLRPGRGLVLDPADFYILATREAVMVPPDHAAEMIAYEPRSANSASITPASWIPASATTRPAGRGAAQCWRCALATCPSCWSMARP